jgi:hypothetical protein
MTLSRPMFPPRDSSRRGFLTVAAGASVASVGALAVAAMPATAPGRAACAVDPAFALIDAKRAADVAFNSALDALSEAERRYGVGSPEERDVYERVGPPCRRAYDASWRIATRPPTTLAGVAAALRFVNEIEDGGMEWPDTDTIGPEGWHYQLRATMAAAIEALISAQAGKAVQA